MPPSISVVIRSPRGQAVQFSGQVGENKNFNGASGPQYFKTSTTPQTAINRTGQLHNRIDLLLTQNVKHAHRPKLGPERDPDANMGSPGPMYD